MTQDSARQARAKALAGWWGRKQQPRELPWAEGRRAGGVRAGEGKLLHRNTNLQPSLCRRESEKERGVWDSAGAFFF